MSDRYIDLHEGGADVALRSGDTDDGDLVGRKIGDSWWAVYASASYIQQHGKPASADEIVQHPVVAFDDSMANHRASVWLQRVAPGARVAARHGSVLSVLYAVKTGVGIAALPTAIADAEPTLQRVLGPIPELTRIWRILTLPQLRRVPRVAAFFDHMVDEIDALRPIITGYAEAAMQRVFALLTLVVLLYALVLALLWWGQERLLFLPTRLAPEYRLALERDVHERTIDVDGARLHALHLKLPAPRGVVFFLHGNAGNLESWFVDLDFFRQANFDLFMIDYRGYGKSSGRIENEAQLHADTKTAWDAMAAGVRRQEARAVRPFAGHRLGRAVGIAGAARSDDPRVAVCQHARAGAPRCTRGCRRRCCATRWRPTPRSPACARRCCWCTASTMS